jgi:hypothetical protein
MSNYTDFIGLGIAGNFALHLEQAGEIEDFKDVHVDDENGPKGMFPFYIPNRNDFLGTYPLSSDTIILPQGKDKDANVQAEPEVGLICELAYHDNKISSITPTHFGAYNDCSIRKEGAKKISHKKNWGEASKGLSNTLITLDSFDKNGKLEKWRICSFLRRNNMVMRYGEDVEVNGYSYLYEQLNNWMINQLNSQEDSGPLENINSYLQEANFPEKAIISIGATRYTPYGEKTFLESGDEVIIVLYDNDLYCKNPIMGMVSSNKLDNVEGISALQLKVQ